VNHLLPIEQQPESGRPESRIEYLEHLKRLADTCRAMAAPEAQGPDSDFCQLARRIAWLESEVAELCASSQAAADVRRIRSKRVMGTNSSAGCRMLRHFPDETVD